jgi:hypothetical protein
LPIDALQSPAADPGPAPDRLARVVAIGLAAGRLAIGAGLWLAPGRTAAGLGFGTLDRRALALARIAATRDLVLGAWQLGALGDVAELRRATLAVAVADAGDALTFGLLLGDEGRRAAAARGLAGALPATLGGAWLARRLQRA